MRVRAGEIPLDDRPVGAASRPFLGLLTVATVDAFTLGIIGLSQPLPIALGPGELQPLVFGAVQLAAARGRENDPLSLLPAKAALEGARQLVESKQPGAWPADVAMAHLSAPIAWACAWLRQIWLPEMGGNLRTERALARLEKLCAARVAALNRGQAQHPNPVRAAIGAVNSAIASWAPVLIVNIPVFRLPPPAGDPSIVRN
jgi:hypothetical protein